ncbi:MAG: HAD-IB family phosphatase [Saprospiraceae bacterium]|jgi:D-3-phosphoglycerate dehydrogenase
MVYIMIDFDSTFMQVEALEELGEIVLKDDPGKSLALQEIKDVTNLGMEGKISFHESLVRRMDLLRIHRDDVARLVKRLKRKVSVSFSRNKAFFKKYKGQIYIISSGFKDFIVPVVAPFQIDEDHVLANTFTYDEDGWVTGFDRDNPLAFSKGKPKVLQSLGLKGEVWVIGDGYTDYEMVEAGIAHKFFAFTENVLRESLLDKADHITPSFDEFLYVNRMPRALSYPKNRIRVLLEAGIPETAAQAFQAEGYQVAFAKAPLTKAFFESDGKELSILGLLPGTNILPEALKLAPRLMAAGIFGAGHSLPESAQAAAQGVAVFDSPHTHARALAELAIGNIIVALRGMSPFFNSAQGQKDIPLPAGRELRGKTLGIIGYGHSGQQLSLLAEAVGMRVLYYDLAHKTAPGNASPCSTLQELLRHSDIVSIHVDKRPENNGLIKRSTLRMMRDNALLLNMSNEYAVALTDLADALESKKLFGACLDALPEAPTPQQEAAISRLRSLPNVLLSPRLGGHTTESLERAANTVPAKIIEYVNTGATQGCLNFPQLQLPVLRNAHRLIHIHENRAGILAQINGILAEHQINILGQYLQTNRQIGYAITDIDTAYHKKIFNALKRVGNTIKFRVLY